VQYDKIYAVKIVTNEFFMKIAVHLLLLNCCMFHVLSMQDPATPPTPASLKRILTQTEYLISAAYSGVANAAEEAIKGGAKIDGIPDQDGVLRRNPLIIAVASGHQEVVKVLIKRKANVAVVGENDKNPLHVAVISPHSYPLIPLLCAADTTESNKWMMNDKQQTPLNCAIALKNIPALELLLKEELVVGDKAAAKRLIEDSKLS
jgi:hypothetical protein